MSSGRRGAPPSGDVLVTVCRAALLLRAQQHSFRIRGWVAPAFSVSTPSACTENNLKIVLTKEACYRCLGPCYV